MNTSAAISEYLSGLRFANFVSGFRFVNFVSGFRFVLLYIISLINCIR